MPSTSEVAELERQRQIHALVLQGFSISDIEARTGFSADSIRNITSQTHKQLTQRVQELAEVHVAVTYARTEKMLSRIMDAFEKDPPAAVKDAPDLSAASYRKYQDMIATAAKAAIGVMKLQNDLLGKTASDKAPQVNINTTILSDSELYNAALHDIQMEVHGETYDQFIERARGLSEVIELPSDRIEKLEQAIDRISPTEDDQSP